VVYEPFPTKTFLFPEANLARRYGRGRVGLLALQ